MLYASPLSSCSSLRARTSSCTRSNWIIERDSESFSSGKETGICSPNRFLELFFRLVVASAFDLTHFLPFSFPPGRPCRQARNGSDYETWWHNNDLSAMKRSGKGPAVGPALKGKRILMTGSTGFLAKVVLEKLIRDVPDVGGFVLLMRAARDGAEARERFDREVATSSVFDRSCFLSLFELSEKRANRKNEERKRKERSSARERFSGCHSTATFRKERAHAAFNRSLLAARVLFPHHLSTLSIVMQKKGRKQRRYKKRKTKLENVFFGVVGDGEKKETIPLSDSFAFASNESIRKHGSGSPCKDEKTRGVFVFSSLEETTQKFVSSNSLSSSFELSKKRELCSEIPPKDPAFALKTSITMLLLSLSFRIIRKESKEEERRERKRKEGKKGQAREKKKEMYGKGKKEAIDG